MGVYIKGMEMPSCCMFCPLSNSCGCGLTNPPVLMTSKEMLADRPDWCPLVSVPPHGRCIDADALAMSDRMVGKLMMFGGEYVYTQSEIDNAPTIIKAEGSE